MTEEDRRMEKASILLRLRVTRGADTFRSDVRKDRRMGYRLGTFRCPQATTDQKRLLRNPLRCCLGHGELTAIGRR